MADKELFPSESFGQGEHPPSAKLNNILKILEENRKSYGPYAVSQLVATGVEWQPTHSSYFMQLNDNPLEIGGVEVNNRLTMKHETMRNFSIEYCLPASTSYGRWDRIKFQKNTVENVDRWYARLGDDNILVGHAGTGYYVTEGINLSNANITSFTVTKNNDSMPIWNGHVGAISFRTDDGHDENYEEYFPVFESSYIRFTMFIPVNEMDVADKLTWNQCEEMVDSGHEIGSHAMDLTTLVDTGSAPGAQGYLGRSDGSNSGLNWLGHQIVDSKRLIEQHIQDVRSDTGARFEYNCQGFAVPAHLRDGVIMDMLKGNYEYATDGANSSDIARAVSGDDINHVRDFTSVYPTWHQMHPYDVGIIRTHQNWFLETTGTYSEVFDQVTSLLISWEAYHGDPDEATSYIPERANPYMLAFWHTTGDATPQDLQAALDAIQAHTGSWWVDTMGNVMNYWKEAHKITHGNVGIG